MADIHPLYVALGKRIRALRRQANLSQEDVAERVGLTRTSITNIERGRQQLQVHTLVAIADTLGVRLDELLAHEEQPAHGNNETDLSPAEQEWINQVVAATMES
jgi:transcriptional regulator with XRE-family HTH domain